MTDTMSATKDTTGVHMLRVVLRDDQIDRIVAKLRGEPDPHPVTSLFTAVAGVAVVWSRSDDDEMVYHVAVLADTELDRIAAAVGRGVRCPHCGLTGR